MSAHTPGPWHIPTEPGTAGAIAHKSGYVAFTAIPRKIDENRLAGESWLEMRNRTQPERDQLENEQEANRRLLATAPELLAALKLTTNDLAVQIEKEGKDPASDSRIRTARAVIAKATGVAQ